MDSNKLKGIMKMNGDNQEDLAEYLGISLSNLNAKINGTNTSFRQNEIVAIRNRYSLTPEDVDSVFFAF